MGKFICHYDQEWRNESCAVCQLPCCNGERKQLMAPEWMTEALAIVLTLPFVLYVATLRSLYLLGPQILYLSNGPTVPIYLTWLWSELDLVKTMQIRQSRSSYMTLFWMERQWHMVESGTPDSIMLFTWEKHLTPGIKVSLVWRWLGLVLAAELWCLRLANM